MAFKGCSKETLWTPECYVLLHRGARHLSPVFQGVLHVKCKHAWHWWPISVGELAYFLYYLPSWFKKKKEITEGINFRFFVFVMTLKRWVVTELIPLIFLWDEIHSCTYLYFYLSSWVVLESHGYDRDSFIYFCPESVIIPVFLGKGYPCKLLPGSAYITSLAAVHGDFLNCSPINLVVNIKIKLFCTNIACTVYFWLGYLKKKQQQTN